LSESGIACLAAGVKLRAKCIGYLLYKEKKVTAS